MPRRAYLLTDAQAGLLVFAAERVQSHDSYGESLAPSQLRALDAARQSLTEPLTGIVRQAEHEHARKYHNAPKAR